VLAGNQRNQWQRAYQVVVRDQFDRLVWDSGRVVSDQSANVAYGGEPLHAGGKYFWKVRVWDKTDSPGPWSDGASWQIALLEPEDWKAKWIGLKEDGIPAWSDFEFAADLTLAPEGGSVLSGRWIPKTGTFGRLHRISRTASCCIRSTCATGSSTHSRPEPSSHLGWRAI
jgi:hypothetical protein